MRAMIAMSAALLAGCSMNPPLTKPTMPVPAAYHDAQASGTMPDWRQMLADPALQRLVELALENNRDLREAALNVAAVQAQYQIQDANRLPALDATAGGSRQRASSADAPNGAVTQQTSAGLAINAFELDFFGRLRSQSQAAFARYLASVEGQRTARLTLIAAMADAYLELRLAEEQSALTERTLADWRLALTLTERLHAAQQRSGLDVAQAAGQVATAEADLHARDRALHLARNNLELLLGTQLPQDLPRGRPLAQQPVMTTLPAGLPSELLARRPDLMQAEQALVAANAEIGAARAAFFPRVSLTAQLGLGSAEMGSLFKGGNRSWSFAPQITQPIFHGGQLRAELKLAEVRSNIAIVQYEHAIQTAFREVNDALASNQTYQRQIVAQQRVVDAAALRERLSNLRYGAGQDSRLELLDAQRQAYAAQSALLELRRDHFKSAIALYKALGGGVS
ncbi:efflux transporter outer membrane subunit [Duganella sp. sic0402]|uniref:efflux transporter outer membrane subunit n=1 Tax=Duganella sp. sic0402 TaxID=2854786 RepID=UPI001C47514F|nr:efflux transporter outer membrane subunit [Duganella sp. sic0402]MBV7534909.1 efflux transporter outer membrane subunit [Duganella sp. sic0402]